MKAGFLSGMHPFSKILLTLIVSVGSLILISILGFIFAILIFDIEINQILSSVADPMNPSNLSLLKYLQILQGIGLFILPAILIAFLFFKRGPSQFGFREAPSLVSIFWVFVVICSLNIVVAPRLNESPLNRLKISSLFNPPKA